MSFNAALTPTDTYRTCANSINSQIVNFRQSHKRVPVSGTPLWNRIDTENISIFFRSFNLKVLSSLSTPVPHIQNMETSNL